MSSMNLSQRMTAQARMIFTGALVVLILVMGTVAWAQADVAAEEVPAVLVDLAFGAEVDRATRTLVGESAEFAADGFSAEDGRVFCLTRVRNMAAPATMTHVWYYEGKTMARVELTVGSADWRTWSSKRVLPAWVGNWEVKVLDASGMVLATAGFTIK